MDKLKVIYATGFFGNKVLYEKLFRELGTEEYEAVFLSGTLLPVTSQDVKLIQREQEDFLKNYLIPRILEVKEKLGVEFFLLTGSGDLKSVVYLIERAEREGVIKLLNHNKYKFNDFFIAGYPFVNCSNYFLKDWQKGDEEVEHIKGVRSVPEGPQTSIKSDLTFLGDITNPDNTIYLINMPPYKTRLDMAGIDHHVGSGAVSEFIEEFSPYLTLHGEIIDSPGFSNDFIEMQHSTISVNPGSLYKNSKLAFMVIDLYNLTIMKRNVA